MFVLAAAVVVLSLDDETEWPAGEHFNLCYAMVSTTHMVRATLKGLGSGPLPY